MDGVTIESLLQAEEGKLRDGLRADRDIDRSREQSAERVRSLWGELLLRYNAAWAGDPTRQAAADCAAGGVLDCAGLLTAGTVETEKAKSKVRSGAIIWLLSGVCCLLAAALVIRQYFAVGCVLLTGGLFCAFMAGRLWREETGGRVSPGLNEDAVLRSLHRAAETMDRKIEAFCAQEQARLEQQQGKARGEALPLDTGEARLFGDLLEALYADRGDYALRQLGQLPAWLKGRGVEVRDYGPDSRDLFELLPTKREGATLRPALLAGETLLQAGRATVSETGRKTP